MNLIAISIRRPVFAWMVMFSLIVFGAICLNRMGVSQLPDVDFPILNISVNYEGAAPEVVEADIVNEIEEAVLAVEGIREMRSSVRQGEGSVRLEFDIDRNVDIALQEVQAALSSVRLPLNIDPPVIRKQNPEEQPIMFLGVYADRPIRDVILWSENFLLDQFRFIPQIGEVAIGGFSERNLRIWPDPVLLRKADLTVTDIVDALSTQHRETAVGQYSNLQKEFRVRWLGEAVTPEEVSKIRILRRGSQIIQDAVYRIGDVARVEDGLSDRRRFARVDGREAISISIRKQRGGNEVKVAQAVAAKVDKLKSELPEGYNLRVNVDFTRPTEAVVKTTYEKLIVAGIVTILVCFLFLGSFQAALNILFSIPTSILGTFIVLYFSGFTLNLFSLLALTLAISIVVDDAIMLLENIVRHYRMGKSPGQAAYDGSVEILPAATAATLAVVAVFIPVVFMGGITGKFFFQFGVTMSAAVLLSLLEAVTVTPMRAATFLSSDPKLSRLEHFLEEFFEKLSRAYGRVLESTLRHSYFIVLGSTVLFAVSLFLIKGVKQEFVPAQDQDIVLLTGQAPPGTSIERTLESAIEVEKILKSHPDVKSYFTSVGAGGPSSEINQFFIPVYLHPREARAKTHLQIMDELREKMKEVKNVRVVMRDISARGLTAGRFFPISFNINGPDLTVLKGKADEIIKRLESEKLAQDLDVDFKLGLPELLIKPDRQAMAEQGVSVDAVARTLGASVAGQRQTRFTGDGRRYDVRVKFDDTHLRSEKDLSQIQVRNNFGNSVPLSRIASFEVAQTYQSINRVNRQRSVGITGNVGPNQSQGVVLARAGEIAREVLPEGYSFSLEGASAGLKESFQNLLAALLMGILVAYIILAVQFNSFVHPVSVLVALPFSITGAILVLWLTGVSLNLFSFIGIIVLMGIAKKNSILLVEFTNQIRERGENNVREALIKACPIRLRPILMTSVATVAAAIPLMIGNSIGQETRTPMGLTIVGGTIVSTLFTLIVVPSLYLVLSRLESRKKARYEINTSVKEDESRLLQASEEARLKFC